MTAREKSVKHVGDLTPDDFRRHPIWTWHESDLNESLVVPVEADHPLTEEYLALHILATFVLRDGTRIEGSISIVPDTRLVHAVSFFNDNEEFMFDGNLVPGIGTLEQLAEWLQKPVSAITPLKYETPFHFADNTPIVGELDLRTW